MLSRTKLKVIEVTSTSASVEWEIDSRIQLKTIFLRFSNLTSGGNDAGTIQVNPQAIGYDLQRLLPGSRYEVQVAPSDEKRKYSWSDLLVFTTLKQKKYEIFYPSEKALKRENFETGELVKSRKVKNRDEYLKCGFKFARPKEIRETVVRRTLDYFRSLDVLQDEFDVYDDFYQGPFVVSFKR
jgi:hypothetical protein